MAEKKEVINEKLEHTGLFDFPGFYAYIHTYLKDHLYSVTEDKYTEKLIGNARDITAEWKATKEISDYFKIEIALKIETKGMTDVEVEIDKERKKMNKGDISIEIKGTLIKDPEGKWEGSPFNRFMRDFYNKFIVPGRIKEVESTISAFVVDVKDDMKAFLDLTAKR